MEGVAKSIINLTGTQTKEQQVKTQFAAQVISDIETVSQQLENISIKYNLTGDEDLIDSLIYEELSLRARYSYLLRVARENNIHYRGNYTAEE